MAQRRDKVILLVIVIGGLLMFGMLGIFAFAFSSNKDSDFEFSKVGPKIAVIEVNGVIESSADIIRQLKKYQDDGSVKALVLRVDSPGGGVAPSQEIYEQLLKFKQDGKYIIVSMGSVAASGGYYIACAADTIYANPGTITGSIGVIFSFPVFQNLMDKIGMKMEVVKSGALKDVGNYAREMSPEDRKMLQSVIDDTYSQFVGVVANGRGLDSIYVKSIADGSIYTGRQALNLRLVDKIGTLEDAISKAGEMSNLGHDPRVVKEKKYRRSLVDDLFGKLGIDTDQMNFLNKWPSLEYRFSM
jgi:protease IV